MTNILWQARTNVVFDSFQQGRLANAANGGNAYDYFAAMALTSDFKVTMDKASVIKADENLFNYWWRMKTHTPAADLIIKEPYPVVFGTKNKSGKTIAMIHHIDDDLEKKSIKHKWFFKRLKKKLPEMDLVVTVSGFWERYLLQIGCSKVKVIYNSFEPKDYFISEEEVTNFKAKYFFDERPIIYIGNAHRQKGVYEVWGALKNLNYQLVMTGSENHAADLPVKFLTLNHREYITLLHASDAVITLSNMTEGWNRIAHEAMLCKTPVIGSGKGGMKELLTQGGQQIVVDNNELKTKLESALTNKKNFGEMGYEFVSRFDKDYFNREWNNTVHKLFE